LIESTVMYEVLVEKKFSAAHYLRDYHGHDEPLHGHNWKVQVRLRGKDLVKPEEYLADFAEVDRALDQAIARVDYKNLNEVPPFDRRNPTAENLARWLYDELARSFPQGLLAGVTVWETENGAASFFPDL